mmetsp:Transcript_31564/g.27959  ORF Transcript_31564/g.27959 Transcript_31564/m.27959 type:complete len:86 (+) Transcript_31564:363-620(+)
MNSKNRRIQAKFKSETANIIYQGESTKKLKPKPMYISNSVGSLLKASQDYNSSYRDSVKIDTIYEPKIKYENSDEEANKFKTDIK